MVLPRHVARLSDLGERKLVEILLGMYGGDEEVGLGDDAAILPMGKRNLLLTTDVVNEGTHVPSGARPDQVGWYVVAVNFSDIAAMGGEPVGFMSALTLPRNMEVSYLEDLARGMDACVAEFDARVLGGDTKEGPDLSICGIALGMTRGSRVLRRTGCGPGDLVAVTGTLGEAGWAQANLNGERRQEAIRILMEPRPRVEEGLVLAENEAVTCCMDISDGLASSLHQLSAANGCAFRVDYDKIPLTPLLEGMGEKERAEAVLYQGGDFELLFTVQPKGWNSLQANLHREQLEATVIGSVEKQGKNVLLRRGEEEDLENRGYEHFQ